MKPLVSQAYNKTILIIYHCLFSLDTSMVLAWLYTYSYDILAYSINIAGSTEKKIGSTNFNI